MYNFICHDRNKPVYSPTWGRGFIDEIVCEPKPWDSNEKECSIFVEFDNGSDAMFDEYGRLKISSPNIVSLFPYPVKIVGVDAQCRQPLVFLDWLEEHTPITQKQFLDNCKPENQRWSDADMYYNNIGWLTDKKPEGWFHSAFYFAFSPLRKYDLEYIDYRWVEVVKEAKKDGRKIIFGNYE